MPFWLKFTEQPKKFCVTAHLKNRKKAQRLEALQGDDRDGQRYFKVYLFEAQKYILYVVSNLTICWKLSIFPKIRD